MNGKQQRTQKEIHITITNLLVTKEHTQYSEAKMVFPKNIPQVTRVPE